MPMTSDPRRHRRPASPLRPVCRGAVVSEITVCPDMPFLHRCTDRAGCGYATCRHCGNRGPKGEDHTCPCPFHDNDCLDHPTPDTEVSS